MTYRTERNAWICIGLVFIWAFPALIVSQPPPEVQLITGMPPSFFILRTTFWATVFLLGYILYLRRKEKEIQTLQEEKESKPADDELTLIDYFSDDIQG